MIIPKYAFGFSTMKRYSPQDEQDQAAASPFSEINEKRLFLRIQTIYTAQQKLSTESNIGSRFNEYETFYFVKIKMYGDLKINGFFLCPLDKM